MIDSQPSNPASPNERLEAYLDDQLAAEQRQEFEKELQTNEQLRREVALQQQVDASIKRLFSAPAPPSDILELAQRQGASIEVVQVPGHDAKRRKWLLTAAALAASVVWLYAGWRIYQSATDDGYRQIALQDIYQDCVAEGFQPDWVCEDDRQFAETFHSRQGQALLLEEIPGGEMVGLAYLPGITRRTTAMLARVEDKPVLVFVDRLSRDTRPSRPSWMSGLKLFRKQLNDLVFYEITPLGEPRVMDYFYAADLAELPDEADE